MLQPPIQNLVNPYRKFIREGELLCKREKTKEKLILSTVFLFNDCVIITVNVSTKSARKYRAKSVVHLKNCVVLDCMEDEDDGDSSNADDQDNTDYELWRKSQIFTNFIPADFIKHEFRVHAISESVIFRARSAADKDLWMNDIIYATNKLTEKNLGSHPLWRRKASYGIIGMGSLRKASLKARQSLKRESASVIFENPEASPTPSLRTSQSISDFTMESSPALPTLNLSSTRTPESSAPSSPYTPNNNNNNQPPDLPARPRKASRKVPPVMLSELNDLRKLLYASQEFDSATEDATPPQNAPHNNDDAKTEETKTEETKTEETKTEETKTESPVESETEKNNIMGEDTTVMVEQEKKNQKMITQQMLQKR